MFADPAVETNTVPELVCPNVSTHARLVAVLCCLLVGVGGMALTVGASADGAVTPRESADGPVTAAQPVEVQPPLSAMIAQQSPDGGPDNGTATNQTDHHRDPESASGDGSQSDVKRWLVGSMAGRLEGSAINLSQGEYQLARSVLREGFGDDLDRYVNVAGDTDTQQDDQVAKRFNETQQAQQNYTEQISEFERLYEAYQEAKEAGDTARARQLAKRLARLGSGINETGKTLADRYGALSNVTGVSLDDGQRAVLNTTNRTLSQVEAVVEQSLVRTELRITSVSPTAAYDDPLVVEGQYVTENGTAIGDSVIALDAPGPGSKTTTASNGSFRLTYRPIDLETGDQTITVSATPDNTSVYLPTTTTVTTDISSVEPRVAFIDSFDRISFGAERSVVVDVTVAERPAGGVPVAITLDGRTLATGRTTESGTFESAVQLPPSVPNGTMDLTARAGTDSRAVAASSATRTVTVESSPTDLSLATTNGSSIRVHGELLAANGVPVADQPIQLSVDGTVVDIVRTNATGAFTGAIDGESATVGQSVTITARYDEPTSNLEPSRASAVGERLKQETNTPGESGGPNAPGESGGPNAPGDQSSPLWDALTNPIVVGAGVVSVAGLFIAGYFWRRRSPSATPTATQSGQSGTETPQTPEPTATTLADVEAAIEHDGPDAAVISLYEVVSRYAAADVRPDLTPRERYRAARDALSAEQATVFERVTTLYEQAKFAPESVPTDRIEDMIAAVRQDFGEDADAPADD